METLITKLFPLPQLRATTSLWFVFWWSRVRVSSRRHFRITKHQPRSAKKMKRVLMAALNIYTVSLCARALSRTAWLSNYFSSPTGIQEKLGILHSGEVFAVFSYDAQQQDELKFSVNDKLTILRKGDEAEREWWWARNDNGHEGYVPRNLFGVSTVKPPKPSSGF